MVDWSRTSQSGPFVYPSQRLSPCDCRFKACGELMAVCSHWGNTGRISEEASETPSQVLISDGDIVWLHHGRSFVNAIGGFLALEVNVQPLLGPKLFSQICPPDCACRLECGLSLH